MQDRYQQNLSKLQKAYSNLNEELKFYIQYRNTEKTSDNTLIDYKKIEQALSKLDAPMADLRLCLNNLVKVLTEAQKASLGDQKAIFLNISPLALLNNIESLSSMLKDANRSDFILKTIVQEPNFWRSAQGLETSFIKKIEKNIEGIPDLIRVQLASIKQQISPLIKAELEDKQEAVSKKVTLDKKPEQVLALTTYGTFAKEKTEQLNLRDESLDSYAKILSSNNIGSGI